MNSEQLRTEYPLISKHDKVWKLQQIQTGFKDLLHGANNIIHDGDEREYLEQLETFIKTEVDGRISTIKQKQEFIKRTNSFDISKVQNLPPDMVYEISTYIQPEIQHAKKFCILRAIKNRYSSSWDIEYELMPPVPKKLLIDLIGKCNIYSSVAVLSKDQKHKWCRMINEETDKIINHETSTIRMDKLLAIRSEEWSSDPNQKRIDKWYKFFLYISVYRKYRAELEADKKNKEVKLNALKNKKISVK